MRILAASVTNAPPEVLRAHLDSLRAQDLPPRVTLDLAYIADGLSEESYDLLAEAGARVSAASPKSEDARHEVTEESHFWSMETFAFLAHEKERLLSLAQEESYDGIWFVDSDLVCGPETLASLIHATKDVVSAVFWTKWQPDAPRLPQVWMRHPYEFDGKGVSSEEFLRRLEEGDLMRVGGLGACTLIRERVFERVAWWPLVDGLPTGGMWQGEDRHFCVTAERNHVELWADAWPDIYHIYRPSDVREKADYIKFFNERVSQPRVGDHVSLALEALEESELIDFRRHVRGRLGALPVLPEIEAAVAQMSVGDSRVVSVSFPASWKIAAYRGESRNILVRLLDAKRRRA